MRWLAALLLLQDPGTQAERPPEVQPLSGEIQVWRQKTRKAEKCASRTPVAPADRIGSEGVGRISIDDVLLVVRGVEARADTGLSAERSGKRLLLKLHRGSAVVESLEAEVSVETPHGKVEGKAVYFLLEVSKEGSRIVAVDGSLTLTTTLGKVTLEGGESVTADGKKPPTKAAEPNVEKLLGWSSASESQVNLVKNPGFEDGLTEWLLPDHRGRPLVVVDERTVRYDKKAARIDLPNITPGPDTGGKKWLLYGQHYDILTPGARYLFRAWIRAEKYTCGGRDGEVTFLLQWWQNKAMKGESKRTFAVTPGAWKCVRFFVTPIGDGFELYLMPGLEDKPLSGTLWLDDFFLAPLPR